MIQRNTPFVKTTEISRAIKVNRPTEKRTYYNGAMYDERKDLNPQALMAEKNECSYDEDEGMLTWA